MPDSTPICIVGYTLLGSGYHINRNVRKPFLLTYVHIEDSNQPAHPRSLFSFFVVRMKKLCILGIAKCTQIKSLIRLSEC